MSRMAEEARADVLDALEQLAQYGAATSGAAKMFDVGTAEFLRYFETEILDDLISAGGATCKIIEGAYGSGKTHLLRLLEDSALDRGYAVVHTDLSQALSLEDWQQVTQHVLENIEYKTARGIVRSLPRVLEALARDGIDDQKALSDAKLPHAGFKRAIAVASRHDVTVEGRQLLTRFLCGDRISSAHLQSEGVLGVKHPLSKRNAELVLKTVLSALHKLGLPGTVLLFDEMEKTFPIKRGVPSKRVIAGANLLRRLIDASANGSLVGTAIVFAVLPDFIDQCGLAYQALGQRLGRPRYTGQYGWRWPVLPLEAITRNHDPREFLKALVDRHHEVLRECGVELNGQRDEMLKAGALALSRHAGSDYRRFVVRTIAGISCTALQS